MFPLREDDHRNVVVKTGGVSSAIPQPSSSSRGRTTLANSQGGLRITVRAPLPSTSLWALRSSSTLQAVELLDEVAGPFHGGVNVSFGAPVVGLDVDRCIGG